MTGGIDEAVVGIVTEANYEEDEDDRIQSSHSQVKCIVKNYFQLLSLDLWLRAGYGVSIGGTGIPIATEEDEKGRMKMTF